jgi:hypothetical protein
MLHVHNDAMARSLTLDHFLRRSLPSRFRVTTRSVVFGI